MDISIRRLGLHRGAPRLYLDTLALARAGFAPGMPIHVEPHPQEERISIHVCAQGQRRVSQKARGKRGRAVIDVNSASDLAPVASAGLHLQTDNVPVSWKTGRLLEPKSIRASLPFVLPAGPRQWTRWRDSRGCEPARWRSG